MGFLLVSLLRQLTNNGGGIKNRHTQVENALKLDFHYISVESTLGLGSRCVAALRRSQPRPPSGSSLSRFVWCGYGSKPRLNIPIPTKIDKNGRCVPYPCEYVSRNPPLEILKDLGDTLNLGCIAGDTTRKPSARRALYF